MVIEHHVPEVPHGQVQLADGLLDRPGRAVIAHQPHHGFEGQSRREQPAHHDVSQARGDPVVTFGRKQPHLRRVGSCSCGGTASRPDLRPRR